MSSIRAAFGFRCPSRARPTALPELELHYRPLPGVAEAAADERAARRGHRAVDRRAVSATFDSTAPLDEDLLLIAGGSGISQCRAIIEHLRHAEQHSPRDAGVERDVSANSCIATPSCAAFATWLDYEAVVDSPKAPKMPRSPGCAQTRCRRSGRIVVSGGPGFVYAVADVLNELGVTQRHRSNLTSSATRRVSVGAGVKGSGIRQLAAHVDAPARTIQSARGRSPIARHKRPSSPYTSALRRCFRLASKILARAFAQSRLAKAMRPSASSSVASLGRVLSQPSAIARR